MKLKVKDHEKVFYLNTPGKYTNRQIVELFPGFYEGDKYVIPNYDLDTVVDRILQIDGVLCIVINGWKVTSEDKHLARIYVEIGE